MSKPDKAPRPDAPAQPAKRTRKPAGERTCRIELPTMKLSTDEVLAVVYDGRGDLAGDDAEKGWRDACAVARTAVCDVAEKAVRGWLDKLVPKLHEARHAAAVKAAEEAHEEAKRKLAELKAAKPASEKLAGDAGEVGG